MNIVRWALGLTALFLVIGCGSDIEPGRQHENVSVIRGLKLGTIEAGAIPETRAFVGSVESPDRAVLSARIEGRVTRILVQEGDHVQAGTPLLTIENNTAGARLAEAKGAQESASARSVLAEKTYRRYETLFAKEAVTPQEMDQVAAELEMSRQHLASTRAAVRAARTALSYTDLRAPYEGRVVKKDVDEGSTVMPGTPLLVLDRKGSWRVRARLPESLMGRTTVGEDFNVEIPALRRRLPGKVTAILPATDPQSRSFEVKISLEAAEGLHAGMFARVLPAREAVQSTVLIPASSLEQIGQLTGVYVVEDGLLRYRMVRTGRTVGEQVEILSGLKTGETIVVSGTEHARNGVRVQE